MGSNMTWLYISLIIAVALLNNNKADEGILNLLFKSDKVIAAEYNLLAMEALDRVKQVYAADFERIYETDGENEYYYKLPFADYYLVYEGYIESKNEYLIHLYEFVVDDYDSGTGHAVTYGWYTVNRSTGLVNAYEPLNIEDYE